MDKNITIYKPKLSVAGGGLVILAVIFFGLTLPIIIEGAPIPNQKLLALIGYWLFGIAITVYPLGFKLEVADDYVKAYLFGITVSNVRSSDIQNVTYGNLFFGSLGGKGLTYRALVNGKSKTYTVGEIIYGKDAIAHAKRVLEQE